MSTRAVSPLVMNAGTADKIKTAAERGLPFVVSNYSMAGAKFLGQLDGLLIFGGRIVCCRFIGNNQYLSRHPCPCHLKPDLLPCCRGL